jgi:hypothetical protein
MLFIDARLSTVHGDQAKLKGYDARIAVHWVSNPTGRCLEPTVTDYLAEPGERPRDADARTLMGADHAVGSFLIDKLRTGERGGTLTRTLTRTSLGRSVGRHDGSVTLQVGDDTVSVNAGPSSASRLECLTPSEIMAGSGTSDRRSSLGSSDLLLLLLRHRAASRPIVLRTGLCKSGRHPRRGSCP